MVDRAVEATEFPSLMDDAEFLAELEKLEGKPPRAAADRASRVALASGFATAQQPTPSASTRPVPESGSFQLEAGDIEELVIPRDANRWNIHPPVAVEEPIAVASAPAPAPGSMMMAFLTILIGFSVGAAGSAFVFHERAVQIIALFTR
jgi:hypothetical protein